MSKASGARARRNIPAALIGNALEWYDFAVYGFVAPIIGRLFFPASDHLASILAAFGVFALGAAARPIGGALFGIVGDRFGRKRAMLLSMTLMGASSLLIAALPTHDQIGTAAPLLLVALRIFQGLSVGGEMPSTIVFLGEHAPQRWRGVHAAVPTVGCLGGFILGSGIGALVGSILGEAALVAWGWRLLFALGGGIALFGFIVRRGLEEPAAFRALDARRAPPILAVLRDHGWTILRMTCLILVGSVGFYMMFVYAVSYLIGEMHVATARALDINTGNIFVMLLAVAPAAALSDMLGRKAVLFGVALLTLALSWPLWWLMHQPALWQIALGQAGFAVIFGAAYAAMSPTILEMLPASVRCTGAAIGFNLSLGVLGGATPFVATYLVARTADDYAPIYLLMAVAVLQLAVVLTLKETARRPLPA